MCYYLIQKRVVTIEELHAMGCKKFIICGGAGALTKDSKVGEIIIPVSAVRDEGTSYLYAGDDVSGEVWDSRNWNMQEYIRYDLMSSAIEIVKRL